MLFGTYDPDPDLTALETLHDLLVSDAVGPHEAALSSCIRPS